MTLPVTIENISDTESIPHKLQQLQYYRHCKDERIIPLEKNPTPTLGVSL